MRSYHVAQAGFPRLPDAFAWIYDIATNTWTQNGSKVYTDRSGEESWVRCPTGA